MFTPKRLLKELVWRCNVDWLDYPGVLGIWGEWLFMSPPFRVGRHIVFSGRPSACLSVCHKSCLLYNLKTAWALFAKLYTNINQHEITCRVQEWYLCLLYFLSYFPLNFVHHKNHVRSKTWKPLKLYSRNFIQVSTNMRRRAECKNSNSVI